MREFIVDDDDYIAIDLAKSTARHLLRDPRITPRQIVGLGRALYALERLPSVTPGVKAQFGIVYREGTHDFREMWFIEFRLSASAFEISRGGSVSGPAGSDTISEPGWYIELTGCRSACDLDGLEALIHDYVALGAEILVAVDSDMDPE